MAHYVVDKRYWTLVGGEIASFWGNQRKACDLPKQGLGMTGNSGPLLSHCEPAASSHARTFHFSPRSVMGMRLITLEPHQRSASLLSSLLPPILTPSPPPLPVSSTLTQSAGFVLTFKEMARRIWTRMWTPAAFLRK